MQYDGYLMKSITETRHIKLSWELLEHKVRYYILDSPTIQDAEYDKLEQEYVGLCEELGKPNTIQSMVGVDLKRPSVQEVIKKLTREER